MAEASFCLSVRLSVCLSVCHTAQNDTTEDYEIFTVW